MRLKKTGATVSVTWDNLFRRTVSHAVFFVPEAALHFLAHRPRLNFLPLFLHPLASRLTFRSSPYRVFMRVGFFVLRLPYIGRVYVKKHKGFF